MSIDNFSRGSTSGVSMQFGNKLKSLFFLSLKNRFAPTVISIIAGLMFNSFRQKDRDIYTSSINNMKEVLVAKIDLQEARTKEQVEREKAKIAVYENVCKMFEQKTGLSCTKGGK